MQSCNVPLEGEHVKLEQFIFDKSTGMITEFVNCGQQSLDEGFSLHCKRNVLKDSL